jgi:hypothetical protein
MAIRCKHLFAVCKAILSHKSKGIKPTHQKGKINVAFTCQLTTTTKQTVEQNPLKKTDWL